MILTNHALLRLQQRRFTTRDIDLAFSYGRRIYQGTGSVVLRIGRKEIAKHRCKIDLSRLEGLHVVCTTSYVVITVYRNTTLKEKDLLPFRGRKKRLRVKN